MSVVIGIEGIYDNLEWIFRAYGLLINLGKRNLDGWRRTTKWEESQVHGVMEVREMKLMSE